jgi:hypothetical protein
MLELNSINPPTSFLMKKHFDEFLSKEAKDACEKFNKFHAYTLKM